MFFSVNKCSIFCHQRSSRTPWLLIVSRVMLSKILEIITIHELRELRNPINQPVDVGIDQSLWKFTSSSYINFCSKSIKQRLPTQLLWSSHWNSHWNVTFCGCSPLPLPLPKTFSARIGRSVSSASWARPWWSSRATSRRTWPGIPEGESVRTSNQHKLLLKLMKLPSGNLT